jgi:hypothetical protein
MFYEDGMGCDGRTGLEERDFGSGIGGTLLPHLEENM